MRTWGRHGLARAGEGGGPGVRIPGALDGFEVVLQSLIGGEPPFDGDGGGGLLGQTVVEAFGDGLDTGHPVAGPAGADPRSASSRPGTAWSRGIGGGGGAAADARGRRWRARSPRAPSGSSLAATWAATHRALMAMDGIRRADGDDDRDAGALLAGRLSRFRPGAATCSRASPVGSAPADERAERWRPWRACAEHTSGCTTRSCARRGSGPARWLRGARGPWPRRPRTAGSRC